MNITKFTMYSVQVYCTSVLYEVRNEQSKCVYCITYRQLTHNFESKHDCNFKDYHYQ